MRTVQREVRDVNVGKLATLDEIIAAYAAEKQHWLNVFASAENRPLLKVHRIVRDQAVHAGYCSQFGLQARMWKLALVDAAETHDKYWQSIFQEVRQRLYGRRHFTDSEKHYANWLMCGYAQFFRCMADEDVVPTFGIVDGLRLRKVAKFVRRAVAMVRGALPRVNVARSFALDDNCYKVFVHRGVQYVSMMTLRPRKRLVLPMLGHAEMAGNVRVVVDQGVVRVHASHALNAGEERGDEPEVVEAIDLGYSEVCVDTAGTRYGVRFGKIMTEASDARCRKGKSRNRLHALAKKANRKKRKRKARHMGRFNLGHKKKTACAKKVRAALTCEINQALNSMIREKKLTVLVSEDLRHAFTFNKPPCWNRRLSSWVRGMAQDRIEFKALAKCFRHEQVNSAYGSQECPVCGFVDRGNRRGDRFCCLHCGHENYADRVGALNVRKRRDDREITRYTPYREVKSILMSRFHRRLEAEGAHVLTATVPGRTPETVVPQVHCGIRDANHSGEAEMPRHPTVNRRAKQVKTPVERDRHV